MAKSLDHMHIFMYGENIQTYRYRTRKIKYYIFRVVAI